MKNMTFTKFSGFLLLAGMLWSAGSIASSVDRQLDNCTGNVTCVAKVLAGLIDGSGSGGGGSSEVVEFYHDDGRCNFESLLTVLPIGVTEAECVRRSSVITDRVWGIKYAGRCKDISDKNFLDACKLISAGAIPSFEDAALK